MRAAGVGPGSPRPPVALWRQLQAAAGVLQAVQAGQSATPALAAVAADLRPGVQALSFQAMRHWGRAQALRQRLAHRAPPPPADALLCTALALAWDPASAPYTPYTLVDQAVEAAKRGRGTAGQSAFINACLRRFLRERDALVRASEGDPVARWNHPAWWIARVQADHPAHWERVLAAANRPPPLTLRINRRRTTRRAYQQQLAAVGLDSHPVGEDGLVLAEARPVHELPGFDQGLASVQDAAAQLAAPLLLQGLAPAPAGRPWRLLDACAAPGGKTAHLLERADAEVLALDLDPQRCARITQTLDRLGLQAQVRAADAARPQDWWDGRHFDGILLDAPCTASGISRRHPDVRWLRREADIAALAGQQARLLSALWPLLAPGGCLVYATCSVFRQEGDDAVGSFVAHNTGACLQPAPGHLLPGVGGNAPGVPENQLGEHDGFYYARLDKRPESGS